MRPAFSSTSQAAAFALLLLGLLLAPALAGKRFLPPREEIYSSIYWPSGDFPYIDGQIFQQPGNMDIVFTGASHIWAAFDTPSVQEQLSKQLGRPATVRTFAWGGAGFDEIYFVAQDLLEHRQVRMLVLDDDCNETSEPHTLMPHMFRFGDNADVLDGLPSATKAAYYLASVAGMPRNLVNLTRANLPADLNATNYWESRSRAKNFANTLGAFTAQIGFRENPNAGPAPFSIYTPNTAVQPSNVCVYSPDTKTNFVFASKPLPLLQLHFAQKLATLVQEHGCKLVIIHVPTYDERRSAVISEPALWPEVLHADINMVGIPPAALFKGLTDDDIKKLYSDSVHLNENGQQYFTQVMTPALLKIYEAPSTP